MKLIYTRDSKGNKSKKILFITHKEYLAYVGHSTWRKLRKIIFFHEYLYLKILSFFYRIILFSNKTIFNDSIKIIHWGVTLNKPIPYYEKFSNVHLSDKKSATITNQFYNFELVP